MQLVLLSAVDTATTAASSVDDCVAVAGAAVVVEGGIVSVDPCVVGGAQIHYC
jgi:hypothetical protein